jgi:hypothetical protein
MAGSDIPRESRLCIERDERTLSPLALMSQPHAVALTLDDILPSLASPDTAGPLRRIEANDQLVDDATHLYAIQGELPLLIPARLQSFYTDHLNIPASAVTDAFLQYYYLSSVKQSGVVGEINAAADDVHYQRHLFRMKSFLGSATGVVLDVGCDDPILGAGLLPVSAKYVGLDPFCRRTTPFRVIGFGEQLPFRDGSIDGVVFNTSLDHILDWRRALDEAYRVLAPGGILYVCTLIWTERADLVTDAVHFHHFRDYEIFGALQAWSLTDVRRYDYKGAAHRHGLYVAARKPLRSVA